jgi:hypothetical protein
MSQTALSGAARRRLATAAMSAFVVWHSLAMTVATAPDSVLTHAARSFMHPYLTLFRLDNNWGFFAPNVPRGSQFRYVVEDAAGNRHTFVPEERLHRLHPNTILLSDRYKALTTEPTLFADAAAAELCRKHAALKPRSIELLVVEQNAFQPEDWLAGKRPLDAEFVSVHTLKTAPCPNP